MKDDPIRTAYERWLIDNGRMPTAIGWEYFRSGWHLREALATRSTEPGKVGLRAGALALYRACEQTTHEHAAEVFRLAEDGSPTDGETRAMCRAQVDEMTEWLSEALAAMRTPQPVENAELVALRDALEKICTEADHVRQLPLGDKFRQGVVEGLSHARTIASAALSAPGGETR